MMMELFVKQNVKQLYPIVMYKGKDPTRTFEDKRINFKSEKRRIILARCGTRLDWILGRIKNKRRSDMRRH